MCKGDDPDCAEFEKHRLEFRDGMAKERRAFLKSTFAATSGAAALATTGISLVSPALAQTSAARRPGQPGYHHLPANADTVHWGYIQQNAETAGRDQVRRLHHDRDADPSGQRRLRTDDQGRSRRRERLSLDQGEEGRHAARRRPRRRRRPGRAYLHRAGGGSTARNPATCWKCASWTCKPRPSANPQFKGLAFGSNAAANWGFQYNDLITGDKPREVVTIYEVDATGERNWAKACL